MNKITIAEGNAAIASFMPDMSFHKYGGEYAFPELWHKRFDETAYTTYLPLELKYNHSWDWIMPVVERIESFHLYFYIETHGSRIEYMGVEDVKLPWLNKLWNKEINNDTNEGRSKLDCTWLTCVQFIEWYNENAIPNKKSPE